MHDILAFHHGSLLENFPAADKVTSADLGKGWISKAAKGHHLPIIPARVIPRGVALQPRYRREKDGSLVEFLKPRVTTDESFPRCGDVESPNAATPGDQTSVELPAATDLPRAAAVVAAAGMRGGRERWPRSPRRRLVGGLPGRHRWPATVVRPDA